MTVISDPLETADQLKGFVTDLDWEKAGTLVGTLAGGVVGYDHEEFTKGGEYTGHAVGKVGGTVAFQAATGGLILGVLDAPKKLKDKLGDISGILNRLRTKLKTRGWSDTDIDVFLKDYEGSELLSKFDADELDPQVWKVMKETRDKKLHLPTLTKVTELLRDTDFMAKLQGGEQTLTDILKNAANPLETGTASKLVMLTEHLENIRTVVKNHSTVDGFDQLISDLKHPLFTKQDGASHALNDMKNIEAGKIEKVEIEFEEPGKPCLRCTFDVKLKQDKAGDLKFKEYKSYEDASKIPLPQFLNYMNGITQLSELKYVFNAKKLSTEQAKDGMKAFLKAKETQIIGTMTASVKTELGLAADATELTSSQIQKIVDTIAETK